MMSTRTPSDFVLDTFAFVAYIRDQAGADRVREVLTGSEEGHHHCHMSVINVGEVAYLVERRNGVQGVLQFLASLRHLPVAIADATFQRVLAASHIKAMHPMSYADAFAAALAQELDAPVLTGDPEFRLIEHPVRVEWIVPPKD